MGTRLQTSQLHCEVWNIIGNMENKLATLFTPKYVFSKYQSHSNGSDYPFKKNLHLFERLGLSVRKRYSQQSYEQLFLAVKNKSLPI